MPPPVHSMSQVPDSLNYSVNATISVVQGEEHFPVSVSGSSLAASGELIGSFGKSKSWRWEEALFQRQIIQTHNTRAPLSSCWRLNKHVCRTQLIVSSLALGEQTQIVRLILSSLAPGLKTFCVVHLVNMEREIVSEPCLALLLCACSVRAFDSGASESSTPHLYVASSSVFQMTIC